MVFVVCLGNLMHFGVLGNPCLRRNVFS